MMSLKPNVVGLFIYDCHPRSIADYEEPCELDCCDLEGEFEGFWTGEQDTWGKLTIRSVDGREPFYLFPDEIIDVDYTV